MIGTLLPWWALTVQPSARHADITIAGWDSAFGKATVVLGVLTLLLVVLRLLRLPLPASILPHERGLYVALAGEALLLVVLSLLDGVRVEGTSGYVSAGSGIGLYIALVGAALATAGGWLHRGGAAWLL
ncbi:MAG: hypothetical protein ACHQ4H_01995 [Ktedonobacterales bacterium]